MNLPLRLLLPILCLVSMSAMAQADTGQIEVFSGYNAYDKGMDSSYPFGLRVGSELQPGLQAEVGYMYMGKSVNSSAAGRYRYETATFMLGARGAWQYDEEVPIRVIGRVGLGIYENSLRADWFSGERSSSGEGLYVGVGVEVLLNASSTFFVEWQRHQVHSIHPVQVLMGFGRRF